jgi:hypothetical protein
VFFSIEGHEDVQKRSKGKENDSIDYLCSSAPLLRRSMGTERHPLNRREDQSIRSAISGSIRGACDKDS